MAILLGQSSQLYCRYIVRILIYSFLTVLNYELQMQCSNCTELNSRKNFFLLFHTAPQHITSNKLHTQKQNFNSAVGFTTYNNNINNKRLYICKTWNIGGKKGYYFLCLFMILPQMTRTPFLPPFFHNYCLDYSLLSENTICNMDRRLIPLRSH